MHRKKKQGNSLNLAGIFIGLVILIVFLSFVFKLVSLIKQSHFDSSHTYNLEVIEDNKKSVISFSPQGKSISILYIQDSQKIKDIKTYLGIIVDGELILKNQDFNFNKLFQSLLKKSFSLDTKFKNLTVIDTLRLAIFAKSMPSTSLFERTISQDNSQAENTSIIRFSFSDPTIKVENKSIEVINATDAFGLGTRLATLISNMSGNVILVNSKSSQKKSQIYYYGEKNYTVERLSNYLNFPISKSQSRKVADITIIIGEDSLKDLRF